MGMKTCWALRRRHSPFEKKEQRKPCAANSLGHRKQILGSFF